MLWRPSEVTDMGNTDAFTSLEDVMAEMRPTA